MPMPSTRPTPAPSSASMNSQLTMPLGELGARPVKVLANGPSGLTPNLRNPTVGLPSPVPKIQAFVVA